MQDRRGRRRDKVIYGGVAEIGENGASRECIVRNISDKGASVEFSNTTDLPRERSRPRGQISLRIARKGRSFLAKVVWWRDNFVGLAFSGETPAAPVSDLEERLRRAKSRSGSFSAASTSCSANADQGLSVPIQSERGLLDSLFDAFS